MILSHRGTKSYSLLTMWSTYHQHHQTFITDLRLVRDILTPKFVEVNRCEADVAEFTVE